MLTRRSFIGRAAATLAAGVTGSLAAVGFASVKGDGRPSRLRATEGAAVDIRKVYWNGHDITYTCFEVDRDAGWARCFMAKHKGGGAIELLPETQGTFHGTITVEWTTQSPTAPCGQAIITESGWISILPPAHSLA